MESKIDFIIYWVDGNDPEWQKNRAMYLPDKGVDSRPSRYRDMGTLRFIFRGIEKFAPWVNNVYFVTADQCPDWINRDNPKLKIINHKDYIPEEYLPTFSSHPIELNFHRIEGLSEQFVLVNDDCFFTAPVSPEDFFVDGKPVDIFVESPLQYKSDKVFNRILFNNFSCIGRMFPNRPEYKKRLRNKILSPKYGAYFFYNLMTYMLPYKGFWGILTPHFMRPYRKADYIEMWEKEFELLDSTSKTRFRSENDISIYLIRLWNLLNGNFVPGNVFGMGQAFVMKKDDENIYNAVRNGKYKMICINDECDDDVFDICKKNLEQAFLKLFPDKSSFEV